MNQKKPTGSTRGHTKTGFLSDVLLAWLPFLVVFISIPLSIFIPNLIEFDYDFSVAVPFLAGGLLSLIALFGLWFLKPRWRLRVSLGLFYLGAYLLLSDIFAPLEWNILDAEDKIPQPWQQSVVELSLVVLLALCWAKLPARLVKGFGVPLVLILFVSQLVNLFLGWQDRSDYLVRQAQASVFTPKLATGGSHEIRGNVYQFVFDGFSTLLFPDDVRQLGLADAFAGFTYFQNTLSNYESTSSSVPSFLVGRKYTDGSFKDWQFRAKDGGLRRRLQESGYEISVYTPEKTRIWMYNQAAHVRTSQELAQSYVRGSAEFRLAQVAAVRLAPSALRIETFRQTDWRFGKIIAWLNDRQNTGVQKFSRYGFYQRLSVPLIRQFIADEKGRAEKGNYIYVHVLLPHENRVWDSACNYIDRAGYKEQTICAVRLMGEIVAELKRLGRFDNSLIIFQSDHGSHRPEAGEPSPEFVPPQEIMDKVRPVVEPVFDAKGYFRRIHPLLLIKPPFAEAKPLRVSRAPAQLIDIPATVYATLGVDPTVTDGKSVFELGESEAREIHVYPGSVTMTQRSRGLLGRTETSFVHISYTPGRGWRAYPDLPVHFD